MEPVGIIQVPLSAFVYDPYVGRGHDPAVVKQLERVFRRTRCAPEKPSNHAEGAIDRETLRVILSKLQVSLTDFRKTARNGRHPKIWLPPCILCIDGKQRIAAAKARFGEKYWWTVRLFYCKDGVQRDLVNNRALRSSHQAAKSDGDIYRFLRVEQGANRQKAAQALRLQLSPCKEKILNQLLRREPPEGCKESVVDALDSLLPYPGVWEGLELANWHKYLALHWDEPLIHFLQNHLRSTYDCIVKGVAKAQQYFDLKTVRTLALRCPQSRSDALFIRKSMEDGELFHGLTDPASRRQLLNNILSIKIIIPSLKTFHENMKYFAIGAKIIRQHILSEDDAKEQPRNFAQRLQWTEPPHVRFEAGNGSFMTLLRLDPGLAMKALFLIAIKLFPYVSNDRPKKDVRGEKAMEARVNDGFVYLLRREARRLGYSSPKIEEGLAGKEPVCCKKFHVADPQVGTKWRCGKPSLRAFLHLYEHAFLPTLGSVSGKNGLVPMFVAKDFLDAFFGHDVFADDTVMGDAEVSGSNSTSITQQQSTDIDMTATSHQDFPIQEQRETVTGLNMTDPGPPSIGSKRTSKGASGHSPALRWQPYSRGRHTETEPLPKQRMNARPKRGQDSVREETAIQEAAVPEPAVPEPAVPEPAVPEPAVPEPAVQEAAAREVEVSEDVPGSPIEVVGRDASRRSPVRPPTEPIVHAELDTVPEHVPAKVSKASRTRRPARGWQPYSRERHSEAGSSSTQQVSEMPKRSRDAAREEAASREAGISVSAEGSPIEVASQDASRRSPVRDSESEHNVRAEPDIAPDDIPPKSSKIARSRRSRPLVRFALARPSDNARRSREDKMKRINNGKMKKRLATLKSTDQVAESSRTFVSQPNISFADTNSAVFRSSTPAPVHERKRKAAQTEAMPSLREWISGTERTHERPLKRLKSQHMRTSAANTADDIPSTPATPTLVHKRKKKAAQSEAMPSLPGTRRTQERPIRPPKNRHMRTSTANVAAESIPSAQAVAASVGTIPAASDSQIIIHNHASAKSRLRQRSPVAAPNSNPGSPSPTLQSESEIGSERERNPTTDTPQNQAHTDLLVEEQHAPQAHRIEQEATEQEFHEVETFAETRTQSPGLTYIDDDWGTSHRSPIATPESDV